MKSSPKGLCQCGCGGKTNMRKKKLSLYINGHNRRGHGKQYVIHRNGYIRVVSPSHHRSDSKGYVFQHIVVMEKLLGRPIKTTEAIHHINGDTSDNSPGNLMLFATVEMHTSYHARLKAYVSCGHYDWKKCWICKKWDYPGNLAFYRWLNGVSHVHFSCRAKYERERKKRVKMENNHENPL